MKIALFAAGEVGFQIAKFFGEQNEPLVCLILDQNADEAFNKQMIRASDIEPARVIYSNALYEKPTVARLEKLQLDLGILAWWPYIIKQPIIGIPRIGIMNFHPSYLPFNRGKHYNFWTIVEDTPFGVTLHFIDKGIDSGGIAFQSRIPKTWEDTGKTLFEKAQRAIVQLFIENFPLIKSGNIPSIPQDLSQGSFHKANELDMASRIELDKNYLGRELLNLLRARTFPPYPAAWFEDDGQRYEARIEITRVTDTEE